uniref:DNA-directed DNA polymerase n=1 Tax=Streptomyces sp. NBC_00049 TaxID=2903617 RepID=A0AAU2JIX0_9ACTN
MTTVLDRPDTADEPHPVPGLAPPYPAIADCITTPDDLDTVVKELEQRDAFVLDVESVDTATGPRNIPAHNQVTWLALAADGFSCVVPLGHPNGNTTLTEAHRKKNPDTGRMDAFPAVYDPPPPQLDRRLVFSALEPLLFSDRVKIAHNAPFDLGSVAKYYGGRVPPPPYGDTLVLAWLLNENLPESEYSLKALARRFLNHSYGDIVTAWDHAHGVPAPTTKEARKKAAEAAEKKAEAIGKQVELHPFSLVADYAASDAEKTWDLWQLLHPYIETEGLSGIWDLEMGVVGALCHMGAGVPIDTAALRDLDARLTPSVREAAERIFHEAGTTFNINSAQQKVKLLYGPPPTGRNLTCYKYTENKKDKSKKGSPSTAADALAPHKGKDKVVDAILDYQEISKIQSTYVEGYLGVEGNPKKPCRIHAGKIHPTLNQAGTTTGRLSCRTPNVQNWPRSDSEWGKAIRDLIVPPPGHKLLIADYAQIELRLLAHFAGEGTLTRGFHAGIDAHTATAAAVFGVAPEDVTKEMRQVAKGVAFAINYGAGPAKVASMGGISERRAREILAVHEEQFPEIYAYKNRLLRETKAATPVPHLRTLLGRKRRLPNLRHGFKDLRAAAERQVLNSQLQGSNADIIKLAMVRLHQNLLPDMQILLSIHDELAVMCPEEIAEEGAAVLHDAMAGEDMQLLKVPITTDVKICSRWSEAK